jgi:hypothetical protein
MLSSCSRFKNTGGGYPSLRENIFSGIQRKKRDLSKRDRALVSKLMLPLQRDVDNRLQKHALNTNHVGFNNFHWLDARQYVS